jgi:hypothetical protein
MSTTSARRPAIPGVAFFSMAAMDYTQGDANDPQHGRHR